MNYNNFLMNTYFGFFDKKIYNNYREIKSDRRVEDMVSRYRAVCEDYPPPALDQQGKLPEKLLENLKGINFFGLNIARDYGGAGLSLLEYLKVVEAIAPFSLSLGITALAHLSIGVKGIVLFGSEAQKRKYLPRAAAGEAIFSYALTEPKTGSDAQHIETLATLSDDGGGYILSGQKTYITNANLAGAMTVFAQTDPQEPGHMGAFVVETSWDGVEVGEEMPKMGLKSSSTAAVQFKNVKVPKENLIGRPGDGFKIAMSILNYGRLALGAASAGMMSQSLDDMLKRSAARKQFGVPINQFELIQEKMVHARVNGYVVSAITGFTAAMLEADPLAPVAVESSHCKLFGTTRAWHTLYEALQTAGGSGYLATQPYELRMRDFRVTTIFEGTTEIHSIYPALYMMRQLVKQVKATKPGRISKTVFLAKLMFRRSNWRPEFKNSRLRRAAKVVRSMALKIRFFIIGGLLLYGENVTRKQFLLRTISNLSLYCFGILAVMAKIDLKVKSGRPAQAELDLLEFFIQDALRYKKGNRNLVPVKQERLHKKVFQTISGRP